MIAEFHNIEKTNFSIEIYIEHFKETRIENYIVSVFTLITFIKTKRKHC